MPRVAGPGVAGLVGNPLRSLPHLSTGSARSLIDSLNLLIQPVHARVDPCFHLREVFLEREVIRISAVGRGPTPGVAARRFAQAARIRVDHALDCFGGKLMSAKMVPP